MIAATMTAQLPGGILPCTCGVLPPHIARGAGL